MKQARDLIGYPWRYHSIQHKNQPIYPIPQERITGRGNAPVLEEDGKSDERNKAITCVFWRELR